MSKTKYKIVVSGVKSGVTLTDYTNENLGIYDGVWTIYSYGRISLNIKDAVQKINISRGGNLASGYTFSFDVANDQFLEDVRNDAVFFNNLDVVLYCDTGSGYNSEWVGVIDSFKFASQTTIKFNCIDFSKARNEKFGSENVPICLNRNYNCKLPLTSEEINIFKISGTLVYGYVAKTNAIASKLANPLNSGFLPIPVVSARNSFCVVLPQNSPWRGALATKNSLIIEVVAGAGIGKYKILGYKEGYTKPTTFETLYSICVDSNVDDLVGSFDSSNTNLSILQLSEYTNTYRITQDFCFDVHTRDGTYKKGLKINDDQDEFPLFNPLNYTIDTQSLEVLGLDQDRSINSYDVSVHNANNFTKVERKRNILGIDYYECNLSIAVPINMVKKISENGAKESYLIVNSITYGNLLAAGSQSNVEVSSFNFELRGLYKKEVVGNLYGASANIINSLDSNIEFNISGTGTNVIVTPILSGRELVINGFENSDLFTSLTLFANIKLFVNTVTGTFFNSTSNVFIDDVEVRAYESYKAKDLSIGTNGENVTASDNDGQYASVTDTIKYLQTTYGGIDVSNINTQSYYDAEDDFNQLPSVYTRNAAHQIVESTDINTVLKEILYDYNLGMFFGRNGKYYIRNFMSESFEFNNSVTVSENFSDLNTIKISQIRRDDINTIISDYELKYNYNEALGEYESLIRIKNTNESIFDFDRDTEGVTSNNLIVAEEAWNYLKTGFNRSKKLSQTKRESKWIKTWFPDSGESEAINFIRNQVQWNSKQHEYIDVTIPVNNANLQIELLTFVNVQFVPIIGSGGRNGWVVKRVLKPSNDTIILTIHLDIDEKDPFVEDVNIIQDDSTVLNEIIDDQIATDEIIDGAGK